MASLVAQQSPALEAKLSLGTCKVRPKLGRLGY
jgi:hypothetical protein